MALLSPGGPVEPWSFERRELRPDDVAVQVKYCGVCASDLAALDGAAEDRWPLVAGHEFTGVITAVGSSVEQFVVGDRVAVGNIVDSCGRCEECLAGYENYCRSFPTPTYLGTDRHDGTPTQGAWSSEYVVRARFAYALPSSLDMAAAAPLLCAGITVWEPLQHWGIGAGQAVGIVGLGGLGHLAVKFAAALGADVTVFTTSADKRDAALELGAVDVVVSKDEQQMQARSRRFDFVLDTAGGGHDPSPYLDTLKMNGSMCMLGIQSRIELSSFSLRWGRHSLAGSGTGSPKTTREMLAFAADRGISADIEMLPLGRVPEALERLARNDVRWRFVLEI